MKKYLPIFVIILLLFVNNSWFLISVNAYLGDVGQFGDAFLEEPPIIQRIPPHIEEKIRKNASLTFNVTIGFYKSTIDIDLIKYWNGRNIRLYDMGKRDVTPFVAVDLLNGTAILALLNCVKVRYIGDNSLGKVELAQAPQPTWNIGMVKAPDFWEQEPDKSRNRGQNIKVAIIDTGVNYNLPDLQKRFIDGVWAGYAGGWNYVDNNNNPMDYNGHGTRVASVAVAQGNTTYIGVAPRARYVAIKAFGGPEGGEYTYSAWVNAAIQWAINNGSHIISMSFKWPPYWFDQGQFDKCVTAYRSGIVLVAAAGNGGNSFYISQPASNPGVIAVGAVDSNGVIYNKSPIEGSQRGALLVAPGVNVPSLNKDGTVVTRTGTSYAAPHVAGAAALIRGKHTWMSPDEVRQLLMLGADPQGSQDFELQGFGLLDCLDLRNWRALLQNSGFEKYDFSSWSRSSYLIIAQWTVYSRVRVGNGAAKLLASPEGPYDDEWLWARLIQGSASFNFDGRIMNGQCTLNTHIHILGYQLIHPEGGAIRVAVSFRHDDGRLRVLSPLSYTYRLIGSGTQILWILSRDLKSDFYNAFGIPLDTGWRIIEVQIETGFYSLIESDSIEVFFDEILIGYHY